MALAPPRVSFSGTPHDPTLVWQILRACILATIAIIVAQALVDLVDLWLAPYESDNPIGAIWLGAYLYMPFAAWAVFLLTAIALMWLTYRLARNLHFLAPNKFSISPTYAIAYYLVPIANLIMPPRITGLIARDTFAAAGETRNHNTLIGWWWGLFLISGLLSYVADAVISNSGAYDSAVLFDETQYQAALIIHLLAGLLGVAASMLMLRVFEPISRAQARLIK